jgi:hypothetical protein
MIRHFSYHMSYQPSTHISPRAFCPWANMDISGWYDMWYETCHIIIYNYAMLYTEKNLSKQNHFQTVQFRQVFDLSRSKLHRNFVHGIVKSVWFRQVFGLLRVQFRQVSLYIYSSCISSLMPWYMKESPSTIVFVSYSMACIHLLHDNAPAHKSVVVKEYFATHALNQYFIMSFTKSRSCFLWNLVEPSHQITPRG